MARTLATRTLSSRTIYPTSTVVASYSETNRDTSILICSPPGQYSQRGQCFNNTSACTLDSAKFYLTKTGSPTGSMYAYIYAQSGTWDQGVPSGGTVLATSDAVDVSTLTGTFTLTTFTFSGANKISLSANTKYVVTCGYNAGNSSNCVNVGTDNSSPSHQGNRVFYPDIGYPNNWGYSSNYDCIFYVYGSSGRTLASTRTKV